MEYRETPDDRQFRERARSWLDENIPREPRPASGAALKAFDRDWHRRLYDGGWAGITWPEGAGGPDLSLSEQLTWFEECARADAPTAGIHWLGLAHAGPTIFAVGSEAQKATYLEPVLKGDHVWCQGFSEPGAGSDLAGLKTRGVVDGDDLVVNGTKIWTTFGQYADFQELLVRTDPGAAKHKGLSWIICPMDTPGITIRPLTTMAGETKFCQIFYDDVRIPLANLVGGLDNGWKTAMVTLGFERGPSFLPEQLLAERALDLLIERMARLAGGRDRIDAVAADKLAAAKAEMMAMRSMTYMHVSRARKDGALGAVSSINRLYSCEVIRRAGKLTQELLGDAAFDTEVSDGVSSFDYYDTFRYGIAAGTTQVQKNIIGERVLGLPR